MKRPAPLSAYWALVSACLMEFYDYSPKDAEKSVAELRKRLNIAGVNTRSANDMIYHSEAIDIASELARDKQNAMDFNRKRYEELKSKVLHLSEQQIVAIAPVETVHLPRGYIRINKEFAAKKADSEVDSDKLQDGQALLSK